MKEKQTWLVIKDDSGVEHRITIRGNDQPHANCTASHESKVGDRVHWHSNRHYTWPIISGIVTGGQSHVWDYSLPIGQRATGAQRL